MYVYVYVCMGEHGMPWKGPQKKYACTCIHMYIPTSMDYALMILQLVCIHVCYASIYPGMYVCMYVCIIHVYVSYLKDSENVCMYGCKFCMHKCLHT